MAAVQRHPRGALCAARCCLIWPTCAAHLQQEGHRDVQRQGRVVGVVRVIIVIEKGQCGPRLVQRKARLLAAPIVLDAGLLLPAQDGFGLHSGCQTLGSVIIPDCTQQDTIMCWPGLAAWPTPGSSSPHPVCDHADPNVKRCLDAEVSQTRIAMALPEADGAADGAVDGDVLLRGALGRVRVRPLVAGR